MSAKKGLSAGFLVLALITSFEQGRTQAATKQAPAHGAPASAASKSHNQTQDTQEEGERIFQQNCSRCHNVPDGFSSRISGTVVRHMRVRASLSQHDEEELLRFLNP